MPIGRLGSKHCRQKHMTMLGSPAIQVRFSRSRGPVQQGPVQRQETQIVQSCKTLDDFLSGFRPQAIRRYDALVDPLPG